MKKTKNEKPSYLKIILILIIVSALISFFIFRDKKDMRIKKGDYSKTIMGNDTKGISPQKNDENKRFQPGDPNAVFPEKLTW